MKHLRLFEDFKDKFEDNKPVVSALKKILSCVKSGKELSSKLNGGTLIDLHDKCSDKKVIDRMKFQGTLRAAWLAKASEEK